MSRQPEWNSPKMRRSIRAHDRKAYRARSGQSFNGKPKSALVSALLSVVGRRSR